MESDSILATDDTMCLAHVVDSHLYEKLVASAEDGACTICMTEGLTSKGLVVNLEHLATVVEAAAFRCYDHVGFVFDGEQISDPLSTESVVVTLLDDSIEPAVADHVSGLIAGLIQEEQDWFEPFDIDAMSDVEFEWNDFETNVKHVSRLLSPVAGDRPVTGPERSFQFVESLLVFAEERAGLVQILDAGTELFRARIERDHRALERKVRESPSRELGPAPVELVTAGRMNAQGVPMLYVARDAETACAEVASHSPYDEVVVGTFILQQPLRILNLTQVPPPRSVFDETYEEGDDRLSSLSYYVDRITRPVILDGSHPVDYAPSQVLTDFFRWWSNPRLDGLAYPSRVREDGINIVLFFGDAMWFEEQGKESSRLTRFQRSDERDSEEPLFTIDSKSVRRYRVKRALTVERAQI